MNVPQCAGADIIMRMAQMSIALSKTPNIDNVDDFYGALIALHEGLDEQESAVLNARLILILANHIGDNAVLTEALRQAKRR